MDEGLNEETPTLILHNSSEALFCIQRLDFKTCLLEAVEELRMRRDSEIGYEKQIHKLVVEKQELEWQKVALQQQKEGLNQQHTEAMAALTKQFQARTLSMEEEKGKYRLAEEAKEREMEGLKETLKKLQISKYTLQKKLNEMEQKLQFHLLAKEDHQKNVNEFQKCHATITCQFGIIKGNHEKLEQNVNEAIQLNKKLKGVAERQASEIDNLKKELKEVTADLLRQKITCHHRVAEENLKLTAKGQELQELQQKNTTETELNTKIIEENIQLKEEKKELIVSLQHMQQLLCRQTETNTRIEIELNQLKKECQARNMPNKHEIDTINKNNKYTQTTLRVSNNLPQGENETKDILSSTFQFSINPTEQNCAHVSEENSHVNTEDSENAENCVTKDDTVHPFNKQPREISSTESGTSDGYYVFEYKETATKRANIEKEVHEVHAVAEMPSLDSSYPLQHLVSNEDKTLLESIEVLEDSVSSPNIDHCRGLNKHHLDLGIGLLPDKKEHITNDLHEIASSTSDALSKDFELQDSINEETVHNHLSTEIVLLKSQIPANETATQEDFVEKCTQICSAKQTVSNHGNSTITTNILLCKQLNTPLGAAHCDGRCTNNKRDEQVNSFSTLENTLHASFYKSGVDSHITNEEGINMSTLIRINLYGEKPCESIDETANVCANKECPRLRDTSIKTPEMSLNKENVQEFQSVDLIPNHITSEKQRNLHTSTGEEPDPASEALNEREELLRDKAAGEDIAKEETADSHYLPVETNMDFINRNVRLSFEPATMEKKAEKTAGQLDLPREYQGEMQTMSASKAETYLEEKLLLQEINKPPNSKESSPNTSIYPGVKEALVSTQFKTVSDTLNAANINADPKRYCSEERNVVQKSLREPSFPKENVTTDQPFESQQLSQISSEVSEAVLTRSSNCRDEMGWNFQNVFIKTQISKIEKLLHSERLCHSKKRKHEEDSEEVATTKNSEM